MINRSWDNCSRQCIKETFVPIIFIVNFCFPVDEMQHTCRRPFVFPVKEGNRVASVWDLFHRFAWDFQKWHILADSPPSPPPSEINRNFQSWSRKRISNQENIFKCVSSHILSALLAICGKLMLSSFFSQEMQRMSYLGTRHGLSMAEFDPLYVDRMNQTLLTEGVMSMITSKSRIKSQLTNRNKIRAKS